MGKSYMNLDVTYKFATEKLAMKEPQEIARNAAVAYDSEAQLFTVPYLGKKYTVSYPDGVVTSKDSDDDAAVTDKILMLHYLASANGSPLQHKWISFKELPDGAIYIQPFTNRAIKPMLSLFAGKEQEFIQLALSIGGKVETLGDTSVTIFPFPNVPITYVIWNADEEFPASGNILFDGSASGYLPTEDYALLSSLVIYHLGKLMQQK